MIKPHNKAFLLKALITSLVVICIGVIVSAISSGFEMADTQGFTGDGSYQVKSIKLPDSVSFAGEKMPLENFDTRESLDRELLTSTYRHSSTILIIKRAQRYLPVIEKILREYNIPDDLKYLPMAESELSNMISPVGATGFWQIMETTGREEGLEINSEVDERYNLEKSTRFACNYFLKSYAKYGNWTLSAASYNGGRNGIDEQIQIQGENNYYDLLLNEETARYIFRVVAYKIISNDPVMYGFMIDNNDLYPEIPVVEVKIDTAVTSFTDFAKKFGTNYKTLKLLNPWLRKPYLTNKAGKEYIIKIPAVGIRNSQELILEDS
jgi:membrane-bound lytic murein transglycosylase D